MFRLIASYPKSGNTYVRIFLAHYLRGETDLNKIGWPLFNSHAFFPLGMPRFYSQVRPFPWERYAKTHEIATLYANARSIDKAVYIVRNPLDIIPSFSRHMGISIEQSIEAVGDGAKCIGGKDERVYKQRIGSWSSNVETWLLEKSFPIFRVRYETLVTNPEFGFRGLLTFLEVPIIETKLQASLHFVAFQRLKETEEKMLAESEAAKNDTLKFREARGSTGKFFNVGKAGGGKEVLTVDQISRIHSRHKKVMDLFGYAP